MEQEFTFDYFVIGGGSGGMASSKEAAKLGARVGLADYVKPSPVGTKWGLGGTCVNVGCIPKKLMHWSAQWGENLEAQRNSGWKIEENIQHDWKQMVQRVNAYIKSLNYGYKIELADQKVKYYNKLARLVGKNTIELTDAKGNVETVTAKFITICVGGRPSFLPDIKDVEKLCITSDDIFSMTKHPGKVLIVGASYIALECAGFLHAFGIDTTVMVRSIFLRGFDQQCANRIASYMDNQGVKFIRGCVPSNIEATQDGKRKVTWENNGTTVERIYDTVLLAIGRTADTKNLGLEALGIDMAKNGKIRCGDDDSTSVKDIFAIGDVTEGRLELTPTAIKAGKLLARRLFGGQKDLMDYINVPTTVFTPIEYGCIGYSEEDAFKKFGEDNIKTYHGIFKPLEWNFSDLKETEKAFIKLVTLKHDSEKVVGFHYVGPSAAEVTQGYGVAMKMGATKKDFESCVGIHPCNSEEIVVLEQVKAKQEDGTYSDPQSKGC